MGVIANHEIAEATAVLTRCRRLLVLAGAGLSADAGVPTFRGIDGLYAGDGAARASREGFAQDPDGVWEWYRERREHIAGCEPHAGQRTLALLQRHFPRPGQVLLATTNEDDLLERAGCRPVVHLHGSLFETRCANDCGWRVAVDTDNINSLLPCPRCGGPVRPGSVWFGEPLPRGAMTALERFDPDGCLVIGSSSLVQPAAGIPVELALAGLPVVEINPGATPLTPMATRTLAAPARDILPRIVDLLTSHTVRAQWARHAARA